jgi:hypothetical protein
MKKTELKEYIKSRISEFLKKKVDEATIATTVDYKDKNTPDKILDIDPADNSTINKLKADPTIGSLTVGKRKIKEADLNEMARKATLFNIAPNFREKAANIQTGGPISPAKLEAVLNFLDGKEMVTGPELAAGVGYEGKMPRIYPIFSALIDRGALTVTAEEEEVEVPETPENEDVEDVLQIDTETITSDEPEIQSTEKIDVSMDPVTRTASTFTVENADLISSIINSFKDSRARINMKEADDLDARGFIKAMQKSKETSSDRLDKKIDQLVDKMSEFDEETQAKILKILNFKFKSVDANSLTKMISNKLGKEAPSVDVQVNADEIDFDEEEISEDVEDIDYGGTDFKDYDSIYERMNKLVNYKG